VDLLERFNVQCTGASSGTPMVFAHGFGCDQNMWRLVAHAFEDRYRVVLFDLVGSGGNTAPYDPDRYATLDGYAADVVDLLDAMGLQDVVFVGHSVSAMIGVRALRLDPSRFGRLVMVGPSPRYIDDEGYVGGFTEADIDGLLASLASNYLGWSTQMAPVIMGNADRPELGAELTESFCRSDPAIARRFAEVTFRSDNRADLPEVEVPTLVLQCTDDVIAPVAVGEYTASQVPRGQLAMLQATGHCPHLSAPAATIAAIEGFLAETS
jgi:sigma-B regulation protein RsbQ